MTQDMNHTFVKALRAVFVAAMMSLTGSHALAQVTVYGNVYGGGNLADVKVNTRVNMSAGTIAGNVFGGGKGKDDTFTCEKAMVGVEGEGAGQVLDSDDNKDKGTIVTISNGTVGTLEGGEGSRTLKEGTGNVYGGGEIGRVEWNTQVKIGVGTGNGSFAPTIYGNVFGAGKGLKTHGYSALVRGNSAVTIQGGAKIGENVYGGGEMSTVGRYWVKGINDNVENAPEAPSDVPDGMPYQKQSGGICSVTIQGNAEIGTNGTDDKGHVFGAGKGVDSRFVASGQEASKKMIGTNELVPFTATADKTAEQLYYEFLQTLALVTETYVTIDGSAQVKGSAFGGSESGFVQTNTDVKIQGSGCVIGTTTYGNVFGGGKGLEYFAEAGKVKGNTVVAVSAGTIKGNIYGGGRLGDVGIIDKTEEKDGQLTYNYKWKQSDGLTANVAEYNVPSTQTHDTSKNTGICKVTVSGGTIGLSSTDEPTKHGNVFGAGRGSSTTWWCEKAIAYATNVLITKGTVNGNVYGGGEVGRVEDDTKVTIGAPNGTDDLTITGSVFGAGAGLPTHGYSALVRGNADITVQGKAKVEGSVYGGGEIASVGRFHVVGGLPRNPQAGGTCTVKIQGNAKIGSSGTGHNVFGACKGVTPAFVASGENRSKSMQLRTNAPADANLWSSYNNDDNSPFIWRYYPDEPAYLDFLETLALTSNTHVTVDGSSNVYGSVFGGGERGVTLGGVEVNMTGGTVHEDVYGGGSLADSNRAMWDAINNRLYEYVPLELIPGLSHVTGYFKGDDHELVTAENEIADEGEANSYSAIYKTNVNLIGGTIEGNAYGGGLGDLAAIGDGHSNIAAMVYGDVSVTLGNANNATAFNVDTINDDEGNPVVSSGRVFGCNNLNGSPMGSVLVTVNKTVAGNNSRTDEDPDNTGRPPMGDASPANRSYEVAAVYGGGNLSDYVPFSEEGETEKRMPKVRLTTCDISVEEVYGGGNAAKVPATDVQIMGAYEIENVFGGGNGADKYTLNGTTWITNPGADVGSEAKPGDATTLMKGGYIHSAYGGSNSKGDVFGTVYIDKTTGGCDGCPVQVDKMVAAGNNADFNRDVKVVVGCQGSDKTPMRFFGADNANVNGNVEVTITSGNFGQVFAGNNIGGAIRGHIIMNIEETSDCEPIRIDELYLGGNEAAYSRFGYYVRTTTSEGENAEGKGDVTEVADLEDGRLVFMPRKSKDDPHYPVDTYNRETNTWTVITDPDDYPLYDQPVLNIISCTYIGNVFGGGYGTGAAMYADPTVNINMIQGSHADDVHTFMANDDRLAGLSLLSTDNPNNLGVIGNVYGGGNAAAVYGNTTVNIGTETSVSLTSVDDDEATTTINEHTLTVLGAYITGNVFGGGNQADVSGNTYMNICGTQNPVPTSVSENGYIDTAVDHSGTTDFNVSIGNSVYGGGNAADVKGNTFVTMADGYVFNGIFGGGYSGSVGTFTNWDKTVTIWNHNPSHEGTCIGKPTACKSGTGTCYVVVSGGQIGPLEVATQGMNRKTDGHGDPVPQGWVWGAGCGLVEDPADDPDTHFKTYVNNTDVTIKDNAFILESIIGGGEFGRVLGNTLVKIKGGQIGVGYNPSATKVEPYDDDDFIDPTTTPITTSNALTPCSTFPYGRNTAASDETPNWVYDTYDPFADEWKTAHSGSDKYSGGSTDHASDGKTWIGCVFAGGSGYMPYVKRVADADDASKKVISDYDWVSSAGWVEGNAEVRISGGHILTNVYGGNEYTDVKGTCIVKMSGGTVGVPRTVDKILENPMIGHVFGAGKGDPRVHFNKVTNVGDVEVEITGGIVYGSVFGGGEDGHVLRNVKMTIDEDAKIGTWGTTYIDGNVFGGGRGYSGDAYTAGNVAGSVEVDINGGNILGSVYGGGQLGSVGYGLFAEDETDGYGKMREDNETEEGFNTSGYFTKGRGHIDITISGGTIGNDYEYIIPKTGEGGNTPSTITETDFTKWTKVANGDWDKWKEYNNIPKTEFDTTTGRLSHTKGGNVFAGGMGNLYEQDGTTYINKVDWWRLGCVKSTKLTITGGTIKSNVYGGGELGQVVGYHTIKNSQNQDVNLGTEITIQGSSTIIGTEVKDASNNTQYTFGSVFGGGYGSLLDKITVNNGTSDVTSYPKYIAGLIKEDTKIDMQGGAVKASIYGGGEMASVGESTTSGETTTTTGNTYVAVSGGTVGIKPITVSGTMRYFGGAKMGNVYGGGSGHNNTVRSGRILKNTNVTISGGTIYHNVYGGGAYGTVGDFTYSERDETVTVNGVETTVKKVSGISGLATSGTGVATVTITGGTIGYDGKENGMVFGSSRGDINKPGERDDHTAWVYDAKVTIGTSGSDAGPAIKGSIYGSGENGHTFNNAEVTVHSGTVGDATDASYLYRGNVYGGGCGTDKYYSSTIPDGHTAHDGQGDTYNPLAGIVYGNTTVTIDGGTVVRNVYGAGAMGSVGKKDTNGAIIGGGNTTINVSGGTIGVSGTVGDGNVYGAARGDLNDDTNGLAEVKNTEVNIKPHLTDPTKPGANVKGSVFGGGEAGIVKGGVAVSMTGGNVLHDVYGGGALANTNTDNWGTNSWAAGKSSASNITTVNLTGGTVTGNVYGGGLGRMAVGESGQTGYVPAIEAKVYGNTTVELNNGVADNAKGCIVEGSIFGCNNMSGSPQGATTVHIYKTQRKGATRITNTNTDETAKVKGTKTNGEYDPSSFDVQAVYGGGNMAAFEPVELTTVSTNVIIDGCDRTSICQVYGGGNAASTPATSVTINGTYEIGELFGGGNGKDDIVKNDVTLPNPGANVGYKNYSEYYKEEGSNTWKVRDKLDATTKADRLGSSYVYGTGVATVNVFGGLVHRVFGGSNTKGNVRQTALTLLDENSGCEFCVDEAYGGGKSAPMDAEAKMLMACIPGLEEVYGGAQAADIKDNVTLTITNGTFNRVFGGNNISGTISGKITVNVEETGCRPVIIGELYGGGNLAAYSIYGYNDDNTPKESGDNPFDDPEVNVRSFTSIGAVYGGGYGEGAKMIASPTVNINESLGTPDTYPTTGVDYDTNGFKGKTITLDVGKPTEHTVTLPAHTKDRIGAIGNVFGGGNAAEVKGNTTVNIGTLSENTFVSVDDDSSTTDTDESKMSVLGADIRGNVYGGGNNAGVTGDTNVTIGKKATP